MRLSAYPKMRAVLDKLPPKLLSLSSGRPAEAVDLATGELDSRIEQVFGRIQKATFTGKGDKETVPSLFRSYVERIVGALQKTLAFISDDDSALEQSASLLSAMPQGAAARRSPPTALLADIPAPAAPAQYAVGRLLLLFPDGPARPPQLCRVAEGGRLSRLTDAAPVAAPLEEGSVLPWRRGAQEQATAVFAIAEALQATPTANAKETAKRLAQAGKDIVKTASLQPSAVKAAIARASSKDAQLGGAVKQRNVEIIAAEAWRAIGASGSREYAVGQRLMVRDGGGWRDAEVVGARNRIDGEGAELHPWNHSPSDLPVSAFDALREWHAQSLRNEHSHIVDALSGNRLDVMDQCVAIEVASTVEMAAGVRDAGGLAEWLHSLHTECCEGNDVSHPVCCALLTGRPAAGKTSLLSQVIVHSLARAGSELVPILVKVQVLQAQLLEHASAFASAWNWVDALLRLELGAGSPLYRLLKQAMLARRSLLLLDGLDEGGEAREQIEEHVTQVLALQGHVIFATSRPLPPGPSEARFRHFQRLQLSPLTDEQQQRALEQRLGPERAAALLPFLKDKVPADDTSQKITANPLMLSMVASIFELRQGLAMPETVVGLYDEATKAMLSRGSKEGGARQLNLLPLVQAVFFQAHVAQQRVITLKHLQAAAREVDGGEAMLKELRERVVQDRMPLLSLLQVQPLQVQSAHLSFQEYFAARAVCDGATLPTQPWLLPSFWRNAVELGMQMGDAFRCGLLRAGSAKLESASVRVQVGGDRQISALALGAALFSAAAVKEVRVGRAVLPLEKVRQDAEVSLADLQLVDLDLQVLAGFVRAAGRGSLANLMNLRLGNNQIGDEGMKAFSSALSSGSLPALETVYFLGNPGDDAIVKKALADRNK